jgi:hypothetical protein
VTTLSHAIRWYIRYDKIIIRYKKKEFGVEISGFGGADGEEAVTGSGGATSGIVSLIMY